MNHIQQGRRKFVQTGVLGFCTALFAGFPKNIFANSNSNIDKGIVVRENEGKLLLVLAVSFKQFRERLQLILLSLIVMEAV
jgi:hypothetical protein